MNPNTETSGKPADIPQDVWDAVEAMDLNISVAFATSTAPRAERMRKSIVARAIMAAKAEEREGCLSDLQTILDDLPSHDPGVCLDMAIRAIRKRGEG